MFTILTATSSRTLAATRRSRKPYSAGVMKALQARIARRYPDARVVVESGELSQWSLTNRQLARLGRGNE